LPLRPELGCRGRRWQGRHALSPLATPLLHDARACQASLMASGAMPAWSPQRLRRLSSPASAMPPRAPRKPARAVLRWRCGLRCGSAALAPF